MRVKKGAPGPRRAVFAVGACATVLTACASVPPPEPARVAKPMSAYVTQQSFAAPAAPWPDDRWWTGNGDPQLDRLIDEALAGSPTLAQAKIRVIKADTWRRCGSRHPADQGRGWATSRSQTRHEELAQFPGVFPPLGYKPYGWRSCSNFSRELDFVGKYRAAIAQQAVPETRAAAADAAGEGPPRADHPNRLDRRKPGATLHEDPGRDVAAESQRVREQTAGLVAQRVTNGLDTQAELKQAQAASPATRETVLAPDVSRSL